MLRLTPPGHRRFEQAASVELWAAGAELNVAVALARLGERAAWVSRPPQNTPGGGAPWVSRRPGTPLGRVVLREARAAGVDVGGVQWSDGGRLGLLFMELG